MRILLLLPALLFLGCATIKHSAVSPLDLTGIAHTARMVSDDIDAKRYAEAKKGAGSLQKLVEEKQEAAFAAARRENELRDRLNYLEPKYSEAVGILWKWRLIAGGSWLLIALSIAWKFRRWFGVMAVAVVFIGCGKVCDPPLPNDCLLDSVNFDQVIKSKARLDRGLVVNDILVVRYHNAAGELRGHCFSIFEWNGVLWAWDQDGSRIVQSAKSHPIDMARELKEGAIYGYWLKQHTK